MEYVEKAEMRKGAAWEAVSHSEGKAAPEQVLDVGAIWRSWEAADAPAARFERLLKEGGGKIAAAVAILVRASWIALENILILLKFSEWY